MIRVIVVLCALAVLGIPFALAMNLTLSAYGPTRMPSLATNPGAAVDRGKPALRLILAVPNESRPAPSASAPAVDEPAIERTAAVPPPATELAPVGADHPSRKRSRRPPGKKEKGVASASAALPPSALEMKLFNREW